MAAAEAEAGAAVAVAPFVADEAAGASLTARGLVAVMLDWPPLGVESGEVVWLAAQACVDVELVVSGIVGGGVFDEVP